MPHTTNTSSHTSWCSDAFKVFR